MKNNSSICIFFSLFILLSSSSCKKENNNRPNQSIKNNITNIESIKFDNAKLDTGLFYTDTIIEKFQKADYGNIYTFKNLFQEIKDSVKINLTLQDSIKILDSLSLPQIVFHVENSTKTVVITNSSDSVKIGNLPASFSLPSLNNITGAGTAKISSDSLSYYYICKKAIYTSPITMILEDQNLNQISVSGTITVIRKEYPFSYDVVIH